ncbi:MAG TPA: hypothetical protein VK961_12270 [Chthoniobacter sp.]|nr:hypothetical protein [Chthoniobacter sp.]
MRHSPSELQSLETGPTMEAGYRGSNGVYAGIPALRSGEPVYQS